MPLTRCYVVDDEAAPEGHRHLPNARGLGGGAAITLCGWVDVPYEEVDGTPDCPLCLRIVAHCKALRGIPKPQAWGAR